MIRARSKNYHKLWMGLGLLLLLSPLGLLLPELAKARGAWGEWGVGELRSMLGYVPAKLESLQGVWKAILRDYSILGLQKPWQTKLAYLACGAIGASVIIVICFALGKWLSIPEDSEERHAP
jgi:cobalt/nickel transport protein